MIRRVPASILVLPLALLLPHALVGCAHADGAADRHAHEMSDAITRLQAEQDKADQRLDALEIAAADEKEAQAKPAPASKPPAPPPRSVQLGADAESGDNDDPNAPDARPEIKVVGAGGTYARPMRGKTEIAMTGSEPPRSSALDPEAKKAYDQALALVNGKSYAKGNEALSAFLVRWPDHPYAENATYWRGEAFFAQGEYLRAAEQFDAVLSRFGAGTKGPDALLKLGMCHDRLGSSARAQEYWDRLKNEYPRSDAAKKIPSATKTERSPKGPKESR